MNVARHFTSVCLGCVICKDKSYICFAELLCESNKIGNLLPHSSCIANINFLFYGFLMDSRAFILSMGMIVIHYKA